MFCFELCFFSRRVSDLNFSSFFQPGSSFDQLNLVFLKKELNSLAVARRDFPAPFHHAAEICLKFFYLNAVVFRVGDVFKNVCAFQQGLCWNTSPVETNASNLSFL